MKIQIVYDDYENEEMFGSGWDKVHESWDISLYLNVLHSDLLSGIIPSALQEKVKSDIVTRTFKLVLNFLVFFNHKLKYYSDTFLSL